MLLAKFISATKNLSDNLQFYKVKLVTKDAEKILVNKCLPVSNLLSILGDDLRIEIDKETRIEFEPTK